MTRHGMQGRVFRPVLFTLFSMIAALCVVNGYVTGMLQGMNGKLNYGATNDILAITIAISENVYDFHHGYVGIPEVERSLRDHLMPDDPDKQELLAGNRNMVESALQAAIALDPNHFTPFNGARAPFVVMPAEDTGLVDFYRLSFWLFGYHADAMYHTFFLLFGLSVLLFLWQARHAPWAAGVLVLVLISFNLMFYNGSFDGRVDAPSVASNRNLGLLSLVATLHLMLFHRMHGRYSSVTDWMIWLLQVGILLFTITVRSSTQWQFLALFAWFAAPALLDSWKHWRIGTYMGPAIWQALKRNHRLLLTLLALLAVQMLANHERLSRHDDAYFEECTMPHHLRWHSAYLSFDIHPRWAEIAPIPPNQLTGDGLAWELAERYWNKKHTGKSYMCGAFPYLRLGLHDEIMRKLYQKLVLKHPMVALELHAIYKPLAIYNKLKPRVLELPDWWRAVAVALALSGGVLGGAAALARLRIRRHLVFAALALGTLLLFSNLPAMFAYPSYTLETQIMLFSFIMLAIFALACAAGSLCAVAARKPFFNGNGGRPAELR